jgi:hypothetical protein
MERRELLKMIALVTGGAVIGGEVFLTGCNNDRQLTFGATEFTPDDITFLDEVGETILPKTSSPGAKDAEVGKFMTVMINDCYDERDRKVFHAGIKKLDDACIKMHGKGFINVSSEKQKSLLVSLDKDAKEYQVKKNDFDKIQNEKEKAEKEKGNLKYEKERMDSHYFTMIKQLTLLGFFTSKPGMTQALRHIAVPGKYDGNLPYAKGDKAWA